MAASRRKDNKDLDRPMLRRKKRLFNRETGRYVDVPENGGVIQREQRVGFSKTRRKMED